jgi:hypothetical protein
MDLKECERKGYIKKREINPHTVRSLLIISDSKEYVVKSAAINEKTIPVYVSLSYDSLREALDALCAQLGFKVLNHVCIGALLEKKLTSFNSYDFNQIRLIRNSINYYGKPIKLELGLKIIKKSFKIKEEIRKLITFTT